MEDYKLSENFSYFELTRTEHRKYLEKNRLEGEKYLDNAKKLCKFLLQPIRDYYCKPLIVHSGFRCADLNRAIGGSKKSQHIFFEACDFHIVGVKLEDVFRDIREDVKHNGHLLKWGQLILEGWSCNNPSWVHISLEKPGIHQQILTFDGKKYIRLA